MPIGQVQEPTVVEQVVQQVAGQVEEPKTAALPEDVDARALAEAKAELAAEQEAANKPEGEQPKAEVAQPEVKPAAEAKAGEGEKPKHMPGFVPLDRFKKKVDETNEALRLAAYHKGRADVLAESTSPKDPAKPEPTPQEQLKAIQDKLLEVASDLDEGKISNRQAEEFRQNLRGQEDAIKVKMVAPKQPESKPQAKSDDLYLDTKLSELETQHPYVKAMEDPQFKDAWDYLGKIATRELVAEGVLKPGLQPSAAQTLAFKTRLAELTDKHGPAITGKTLDLPTKAKAPEQPKPGSPSKTAEARAQKLTMQADMPPDVSQLGSSPSANPDHSDAAIERMDEEDIAKLPKATRDRILGRVPS
jgi:hypothetical protein